jgi:glutamate-1-semialdehyde aminotransferase
MSEPLNIQRSAELWQRAVQLIPGGSQTNSKRPAGYAPGAFPIFIERGRGCRVWDVDGNEFIDYIQALGPITLGYCYDRVDDAIRQQLERGIIFGLLSPLEVEAAQAVCDMVPCAEMVRFLKGGAEATSAAARIVRAYTGAEVILNSGYRGWSDTWSAQQEPPAGAGVPECLRGLVKSFPRDDPDALRHLLTIYRGKVAGVFLDCASGTAAPRDVVIAIRELCDEFDVPLCFDEIVTGFRLAPGGAQEYYGVTPDLACFAKGIANGMPIACVCGKREIMQIAEGLIISVTYGGEALSLAALIAALREYREKPVHAHLWQQGKRLVDGLTALAQRHGVPLVCTGLAPMAMPVFRYPDPSLNTDVWSLFLQETAARGVLIRRGGLLFVTYSHTPQDIDATLAACDAALAEVAAAVEANDLKSRLRVGEIVTSFRRF